MEYCKDINLVIIVKLSKYVMPLMVNWH